MATDRQRHTVADPKRQPAFRKLQGALDATDHPEVRYHIRQAMQRLLVAWEAER